MQKNKICELLTNWNPSITYINNELMILKLMNESRKDVQKMKAKLQKPENMGNWVTLAELPFVKKLLKNPGELLGYDRDHEDDWFADGIDTIKCLFNAEHVITATAELAKNERTNDSLCADSGRFDIWFDVLMEAWIPGIGFGYVKVGAYLTDLWMLSPENKKEVMSRMYIKKFAEVE